MSEEAAQEEHPLHEVLNTINKRATRLGAAKAFDGELARREFRDELYPLLAEIAAFVGELDDRIAALETGEVGIPRELAEAIVEGFARFGAALDVLSKHVPAGSDADALAEHRAWYTAAAPGIIRDVRDAATDEEEGDEDERPEAPEAP